MNSSTIRIGCILFSNSCHRTTTARRFLSHYPIDDTLFNLTDEQIQVRIIRKTKIRN